MDPTIKVISYKKPDLWRIRGHSKFLKKNKVFHVICFEPGTAIEWAKTIVSEDFKTSSAQIVGSVDFVGELGVEHLYYSTSFQRPSGPNSWIYTERAGVSAQNLIQAGAVLLKNIPTANLLSINHVGRIDAILDVPEPLTVIPSDRFS